VRQTIVKLVVTQRHDIRRQVIHDLHGGDALVLGIDHRALQHVTGDHIEHIFLFPAHTVDIAREQREPTDELAFRAAHLGHKVAVHVIRMQDGEFARIHAQASAPRWTGQHYRQAAR